MNSQLRALVDLRAVMQKSRIAFTLRINAIERGVDTDQVGNKTTKLLERWEARFRELEEEADDDIVELVKDLPIVDAMVSVKGVGPMLAAKTVAMIDIERADTVSSLWKYAGYGVTDGERDRRVKGESMHYNQRLKATCYLVGTSFLRSGSPYRAVYDSAREYYDANRPDWTKMHRHQAAMRKMIKMWLSHLWEVWRTLEGLPIRAPYVQEKLGHTHMTSPQEFGWPETADIR